MDVLATDLLASIIGTAPRRADHCRTPWKLRHLRALPDSAGLFSRPRIGLWYVNAVNAHRMSRLHLPSTYQTPFAAGQADLRIMLADLHAGLGLRRYSIPRHSSERRTSESEQVFRGRLSWAA